MTLYDDVAAGTTGRAWMICRQSSLAMIWSVSLLFRNLPCGPLVAHPRVRLGPQVGVRELLLFGGRRFDALNGLTE